MSKASNPTKAPVPKPARSLKMSFMGAAVAPTTPASNMTEKLKDMSFKVDPEFHRRYKSAAALNGVQMKDILEESFELWMEKQNSK